MVTITIQSLTKRFGGSTVLNSVDLQIKGGELFFLLGPSGCGKTTLLRHVAGFYQPDAGRVYFDDLNVTQVPPHQRDTGMMFQSYALWPHMSVAENVAFGLEERQRPKSEIKDRVHDVLGLVQLEGMEDRRIQQLSGGQQQRVALARALVIQPKVLLLDEPLSNLDAKLRYEMRAEIRRIVKECGLTGIYVTHDREEALSMGDRLAIMEKGNLIQIGTPSDVYRNPMNKMVAEFMGETNIIEGVLLRDTSRTGLYDVETAAGVFRGRPFDPTFIPVRGQPVLISIRPEAFSFIELPDSPNRFMGRILDTSYLGATVEYHAHIGGDQVVRATQQNPATVLHAGSPDARLMVASQDVVILRK
jgi:iron(III) transport system ATP-binding protein